MTLTEKLGGRDAITAGIVAQFRALSALPHPSYHERAVSDWLVGELTRHGLSPIQDGAGNLMADVPATQGREGVPRLILQGHLDMVCAAAEGFDPLTDAVTIVEENGVLHTDGRSALGADNHLGSAAVLWLLGQNVNHGPLRLLFTTAEEVGLEGAKLVPTAWLEGCDYLLNTDGFHLGRAVIGSASGRRETYRHALETEENCEGLAWRIDLTGGAGGHSGDDIHRGRANAVQLMAQLLDTLPCRVADFYGGTAHNAIAASAHAVVCGNGLDVENFRRNLGAEFEELGEHLSLTCTAVEPPPRVWTNPCAAAVLQCTCVLFHGVYAIHHAIENVVGASANVGNVWTADGQIHIGCFVRSARNEEGERLAALHDRVAARYGFTTTISGYPCWTGDGDNKLVELMDRVFRRVTGHWMDITAVHVGLEPSIFQDKRPDLVMVSTGPDIENAHSVDERAPLEHLPEYALLLAGVLEGL